MTDGNYEGRIERILATIDNPSNRDTLRAYLAERRANGIRPSTLANDAQHLRDLALLMGTKPFQNVTKADVVAFVNQRVRVRKWVSRRVDGTETVVQRETRLSDTTMTIRAAIVKCFFRWVAGDGKEYPQAVAFLKTSRTERDSIPTDDLITVDDMRAMLAACDKPRDRALLAVLYEGGFRAGEICALDVASVVPELEGTLLRIPKRRSGLKTGARQVRLYADESGHEYLKQWLEAHPAKHDPRAPLFINQSQRSRGERLNPTALHYIVRTAGERAGLKKSINPHLFRHSCATQRAFWGWNEFQMRAYFGWTRKSSTPSQYVHMAGLDYDNMELARRGLRQKDPTNGRALPPAKCRVCGMQNLPTLLYCSKCSSPLTKEAAQRLQIHQSEILAQLVRDEVARLIQEAGARPHQEA